MSTMADLKPPAAYQPILPDDILALENRVADLHALLDVGRKLSHIRELKDLYASLADIVRGKIGIGTLSIVICPPNAQAFRLVYSYGLEEINREYLFENIGALRQILTANEPIRLFDAAGRPLYPDLNQRFNFDRLRAEWLIPMLMQNRIVGFLTIGGSARSLCLTADEDYFLRQIAAQAAVCINTCHLYRQHKKEKAELNRTLYNLSLLYNIGRAMTYISDLKSLLQYILNQAIEITGAEKGSIMLYDIETERLSLRVLAGLADKAYQKKVNNNEIECRSFKPGEGIAGRVFQSGRPIVVDNAGEEELFIEPAKSFVRSIACIPMKVHSDPIGVINVTNKRDESGFKDEEVELLKAVADQAAVAINKAQLWEMAVTDSLTGLFVRRYFMAKFQEELHRAERYAKSLAVVIADLDRFKEINDSYGHSTGDRVLRIIGQFLQRNIRSVDIIARFGGEEFSILLPEVDKAEALRVSERLRHKLLPLNGLKPLTISLGVAAYPEDGNDLGILIRNADAAMYAAKQTGRNRVMPYQNGMDGSPSDQSSVDGSLSTQALASSRPHC